MVSAELYGQGVDSVMLVRPSGNQAQRAAAIAEWSTVGPTETTDIELGGFGPGFGVCASGLIGVAALMESWRGAT